MVVHNAIYIGGTDIRLANILYGIYDPPHECVDTCVSPADASQYYFALDTQSTLCHCNIKWSLTSIQLISSNIVLFGRWSTLCSCNIKYVFVSIQLMPSNIKKHLNHGPPNLAAALGISIYLSSWCQPILYSYYIWYTLYCCNIEYRLVPLQLRPPSIVWPLSTALVWDINLQLCFCRLEQLPWMAEVRGRWHVWYRWCDKARISWRLVRTSEFQ